MPSLRNTLACTLCSQRFSHKSSLVRHSKRCSNGLKGLPRRKSCRECAIAKVRCDLDHPVCRRCRTRGISCEFSQGASRLETPPFRQELRTPGRSSCEDDATYDQDSPLDTGVKATDYIEDRGYTISPSFNSSTLAGSSYSTPGTFSTARGEAQPLGRNGSVANRKVTTPTPILTISDQRRQELLGNSSDAANPEFSEATRHTAYSVSRILKSWPRLMATHSAAVHLPPMMHNVQFQNGAPPALARCYTLTNMVMNHADGSGDFVRETCLRETRRLIDERGSYSHSDLIAAAQSLLILTIMLVFSSEGGALAPLPISARLLVDVWDMQKSLAATGLFLEEEMRDGIPSWESWALVSAKRRVVLSFHHVEWAWSVIHGYPILTCFEIAPLPAPAAGYLWRESSEAKWQTMYRDWLRRWEGGSYKMAEFFHINAGDQLDHRSEAWLSESDEFGLILITEVNAVGAEPPTQLSASG